MKSSMNTVFAAWPRRFHAWRLGDTLFIIIFCVAYLAVLFGITPHHPFIPENNPLLSYPKEAETVGPLLLFTLAMFVPLAIMIFIVLLRRTEKAFKNAELHSLILSFCITILSTLFLTEFIKKFTGYPRPNFYALTSNPDATSYDLREAYQSFPSGHSSMSFAGLGFLSMFLYDTFSPLSVRRRAIALLHMKSSVREVKTTNPYTVLLLCATPLLLAAWIATTRVVNYWHHPADITCGGILGLFVAHACYQTGHCGQLWQWLPVGPIPAAWRREHLLYAENEEEEESEIDDVENARIPPNANRKKELCEIMLQAERWVDVNESVNTQIAEA
jgi:diacylglycerol diphosphate phosphatase/phosphatidate phosphatase